MAEAIRTLKDDAGEALVRAGLSNALPAARSAALQQVVAVGLEDAFDVVVAALKDPAGYVRSAALFALVAIGDARALPLMEPLLDDPDPYNRANPYPVSYTAEVCIAKLKKKLSG